jgi:hypothetical protein
VKQFTPGAALSGIVTPSCARTTSARRSSEYGFRPHLEVQRSLAPH